MILVVGGTGSVGGRIVDESTSRGDEVRALARSTSDTTALRATGAEIVVGDLKDPSSLERACDGIDVVITTASATKTGDDTIENVDGQGNQNLIAAARAAGVRHFIFVSTIGAAEDSEVAVFRAKGAAERRIMESGMTYTILHANAFMDVWFASLIEMPIRSGMPVTLVGESRRRHSFVTERDVAAFAVAAVREPAGQDVIIDVGGPEALTFRDVVRAYEEALGRPIEVRTIAPGEPIPGLPDIASVLAAGLEAFDSVMPMDATARRFGVELTNARAFARGRFATSA